MKKGGRGANRRMGISPRFALSGALKDIEFELKSLGQKKTGLRKLLGGLDFAIGSDRTKQKELEERIARLIEKEAQLTERKKRMQSELDRVADKIGKISKIKSEMSNI